ncbi:hypothetical protein [Haloterrigena salifodinae]|uniref:hypothetical protein n=1 Tax=Haloterrigena salifodinae TaxID=2675099 RepID=UPI000F8830A4|nr:hypothetical protein [Haloterrigena salifodinae]
MTGALVLSLVELDDVSVSKEDDHILVTCRGHDGADAIELDDVHQQIYEADCRVRSTVAAWSSDGDAEVLLEVVER